MDLNELERVGNELQGELERIAGTGVADRYDAGARAYAATRYPKSSDAELWHATRAAYLGGAFVAWCERVMDEDEGEVAAGYGRAALLEAPAVVPGGGTALDDTWFATYGRAACALRELVPARLTDSLACASAILVADSFTGHHPDSVRSA